MENLKCRRPESMEGLKLLQNIKHRGSRPQLLLNLHHRWPNAFKDMDALVKGSLAQQICNLSDECPSLALTHIED